MRRNLLATTLVFFVFVLAAWTAHSQSGDAAKSPTYPDRCDAEATKGYVLVTFNISPEGKPIDLVVDESCPSDIFVEATLKAIRDWDYQPTGEIQVGIQILMPFKLSKPTEDVQD